MLSFWNNLASEQCTLYFQCWLNGYSRSRLWLNSSVAKFYAMWQHTNNEQWWKNWVSCLLKLLSNYNFKCEILPFFYDFQSTLTIVPICALIYQYVTYIYHFQTFFWTYWICWSKQTLQSTLLHWISTECTVFSI